MRLDRIFTTCPYLAGSPEGVVCMSVDTLIRNIVDINPDNCISRHFELCHLYIVQLQEIDVFPVLSGNRYIR
jgi:hypothetical protein